MYFIIQSRESEQAIVYSCETDSCTNIVDSKFYLHIIRDRLCWLPSVIVKGNCYWDCFDTSSDQFLKFEARNNEFTYLRLPMEMMIWMCMFSMRNVVFGARSTQLILE